MKRVSIALALVALMATYSQAQVKIGARAGAGLANMSMTFGGEDFNDNSATLSFHIGGVLDVEISDAFSFQPSLLFVTKGTSAEFGDEDFKTSISYVEVPLNAMFKFGDGDTRFTVHVGPYVGFALGGTAEGIDENGEKADFDLEFGNDPEEHDLKPLDFGAQAGVGVELNEKIGISAQYSLGLANLVPEGDSDNSATNSVISLGVSFFFND